MQDTNRVGNAMFYGLMVDILPTVFTHAGPNGTSVYELAPVSEAGALANSTWSGLFWMLLIFIAAALRLAGCEWAAEQLFEKHRDFLNRLDGVCTALRSGEHKRFDFNHAFSVARKSPVPPPVDGQELQDCQRRHHQPMQQQAQ